MSAAQIYHTIIQGKGGRIGELRLRRKGEVSPPLSTPILYPVVSFLTGSTPRGGGLWKYLLRDFMKTRCADVVPSPALSGFPYQR